MKKIKEKDRKYSQIERMMRQNENQRRVRLDKLCVYILYCSDLEIYIKKTLGED